MVRIISYLLISEDIADDAENLADLLRKAYGVKPREISAIWKKSGGNYSEFLNLLQAKLGELKTKIGSIAPGEQPGEGIALSDYEELSSDIKANDTGENIKDEAVIDVLKYLAHLWRSKDRVRVIAARFGLDPDIYAAAGLGVIPDDYSDEDIWNTMDQSNQGQLSFYQSAWQPYYIDTLERLKELPLEIKQEISDIVQQSKENKRDVPYPVRSDRPYDDYAVAYEAILVDDIFVEGNDIQIISKGSKIFVLKS